MMELRAEKISQDFLRYSAKDGYFIAVQETDLRLAAGGQRQEHAAPYPRWADEACDGARARG